MSDRVLFSFYDVDSGKTIDWTDREIGLPGATDYEDALKGTSQLTNFIGHFGVVYGGLENCLDLNNGCRAVSFQAESWISQGKYPFTIKGGCKHVRILGRLIGHGTEVDVDAGNWSDQSHEYVENWELGLVPFDGKPITIRCLAATKPTFVAGTGPYKFVFPHPDAWYHSIVVKLFNQLRRIGLFK